MIKMTILEFFLSYENLTSSIGLIISLITVWLTLLAIKLAYNIGIKQINISNKQNILSQAQYFLWLITIQQQFIMNTQSDEDRNKQVEILNEYIKELWKLSDKLKLNN